MNVQHNFSAYFKGISFRRYLLMLAGNLLIGVGISIFKLSGLGNDPFSGMTMALSDFLHIPYAHFWLLLNIVLFCWYWYHHQCLPARVRFQLFLRGLAANGAASG